MQFSNEGSLRPDGMRAIANDNHPSPPKQGHPVLIRATPLNKIRIRSIISCKRTYTSRMHNSCVVRARMLRRKGLERPTYLYIYLADVVGVRDPPCESSRYKDPQGYPLLLFRPIWHARNLFSKPHPSGPVIVGPENDVRPGPDKSSSYFFFFSCKFPVLQIPFEYRYLITS